MDWLQFFTTTGALSALGLAMVAYLRTRPAMKLAQLKGEEGLWLRVEKLETELVNERDRCDERINRIEQRHSTDVAELKAEVRVLRHDRNNLRQAFNALLVMLKKEDADIPKIIEVVEELVARGDAAIAVEKAAISVRIERNN